MTDTTPGAPAPIPDLYAVPAEGAILAIYDDVRIAIHPNDGRVPCFSVHQRIGGEWHPADSSMLVRDVVLFHLIDRARAAEARVAELEAARLNAAREAEENQHA